MNQSVTLGNPFISMLCPLTIDEKGLQTTKRGHVIRFDFITEPHEHEVDTFKKCIKNKEKLLYFLKKEIVYKRIFSLVQSDEFKHRVAEFQKALENEMCADVLNAFWERKRHMISLPYVDDFDERIIPTKARPIQMNDKYLKLCHEEIAELLRKGLIRKSYSAWSCPAFFVENAAELEERSSQVGY